MKIEHRQTEKLIPYIGNPKAHPDSQIKKIMQSIEAFGFNVPVLVDGENGIIAGHGRLLAAQRLNLETVPVIEVTHLTPEQVRAFRIADNKIAESSWSPDALKQELLALNELGFELELTGFDNNELEQLLGDELFLEGAGQTGPDEVPDVPDEEPITHPGDLWLLGEHRLLCGDATVAEHYHELLGSSAADMIFTDPPYNVNYVSKNAKKLTIMNDNLPGDEFFRFLLDAYKNMFSFTQPGGAIYVCHADTYWRSFRLAFEEAGWLLKQCLIWVKNQFVLCRQDYHWRHEPILYGWKPGAAHKWYGGRKNQTVLEELPGVTVSETAEGIFISCTVGLQTVAFKVPSYEVINTGDESLDSIWRIDKPLANEEHPTIKPTAVIARAIMNSSPKGGIVLDVFGGSGSTLISCEETRRKCRMMELSPHYCDVIIKRWENFTGKMAALSAN